MIKSLGVATLLGTAALLSSCGWVEREERALERRFVNTAIDSLVNVQQSALEEEPALERQPGSDASAPHGRTKRPGVVDSPRSKPGTGARRSTQLCSSTIRRIERTCPITGRRQRLVLIADASGAVREIREESDSDV